MTSSQNVYEVRPVVHELHRQTTKNDSSGDRVALGRLLVVVSTASRGIAACN